MKLRAPGEERTRADARRRAFVFAGLAGTVAAALGLLGAALRFLVPDVLYENPTRFPLGKPEDFPPGSATYLAEHRLFVFNTPDGFCVLSAVCTHLGCNVNLDSGRGFTCPCHGSAFDLMGRVQRGPAPWPLPFYALTRSRRGELVVDTLRTVAPQTRLRIS